MPELIFTQTEAKKLFPIHHSKIISEKSKSKLTSARRPDSEVKFIEVGI